MLNYFRPKTIKECLEFITDERVYIAGGTDLMVELKKGHDLSNKTVIDLTHIPELSGVKKVYGELEIMACTTHDDIVLNKDVNKCLKALSLACRTVGSPQIRNKGTVGGSVGTASPASDPMPALMLADGRVVIINKKGEMREEKLEDFIIKPGVTTLKNDEMILSLKVKSLEDYKQSFFKIGRRKALAIARLNFAMAILMNNDETIKDIRIVVGAALPVTKRFYDIEKKLIGKKITKEVIEQVSKQISEQVLAIAGPRKSSEYKIPVIRNVINRMLKEMEV
ncbi:MAG: FAD binding domain-containing protein [Firmicutes bacterium]|nr:FAD binding domain-containing protein [Bacillota bacterium]